MKPRRWLWVLLCVPLVLGLARLRFDTEVLHLLPTQLPEVHALKLWQQHFAGSRDLMITLRADDPEIASAAALAVAQSLRAAAGLTGEVHWQAPWREHPGESAEIAAAGWLNSSSEEVRQLAARLDPERLHEELAAQREQLALSLDPGEIARLSYDPLGLLDVPALSRNAAQFTEEGPPFASVDGTFRVIHVQPPEVFSDYRAAARWLEELRERVAVALAEEHAPIDETIRYTGGPVFLAEIAADMERDMIRSVAGTAFIVALLFFLVHGRIKPLLWLVLLLAVILAATMAAGGLLFGRLNVVSLGFAAILLGLAVDYGLVLYQERLVHRERPLAEVRRWVAPGIWWSAVTTASAFLLLNFGGLPGLAQLGSLVGVGVVIAAAVMTVGLLPLIERASLKAASSTLVGADVRGLKLPDQSIATASPTAPPDKHPRNRFLALAFTLIVGGLSLLLVVRDAPRIDASSEPLRPVGSPAYAALDDLRAEIGGDESLALLVTGEDEQAVADRLRVVEQTVARLTAEGRIESAVLPGALWPDPANQQANRKLVTSLLVQRDAILQAARNAGFTDDSLRLATGVFETWRSALNPTNTFWPGNSVSRWILRELTARDAEGVIAAGLIKPQPGASTDAWIGELQSGQVFVASWERLGPALLREVEGRLRWVLIAIGGMLLLTLSATYRRWQEVFLSVSALAFSGLLLLAVMSVAGWSWNLMNLMAVPLLLGATVDYSIHMQLSLRRNLGEVGAAFNSTGKALLLCAATTAAGFGSLGLSSNAGLASLGKVCGAGAICAAITACFLLPCWWRLLAGRYLETDQVQAMTTGAQPETASRIYGFAAWRLGLRCARWLPVAFARVLGANLAAAYGLAARSRRRVVEQNLLPVVGGDRLAARRTAGRLFRNFGIKLADLLRYESGRPVDQLFRELPPPERFAALVRPGRGAILLTVHLGNWEFGAPLLRRLGVKLLVVTLAEPGTGFTELRERARRQWGVETLVIGQDAFAFVEVLKRLQEGALIALLIDRPPAGSGVMVELFDRPFAASVSAAELARASGCALIPVALPWTRAGYEIIVLPEVPYERSQLGDRESRRALTQEILRAFAPVIRQHPDQWFHFVPIWPE